MEETTTTDPSVDTGGQVIQGVAVDNQGMAVPQPEEPAEPATADEPTTEEPEEKPEEKPEETTKPTEEVTEEPSEQEQLDKFAKTKGLTLDSENAVKAAKMAMNAEKLMHEKTVKASELEKTLDKGITQEAEELGITDDDRVKIAKIETKLKVREFFEQNPDAKQFEQAMIQELSTKPHLAGDLESLYANAVVKTGNLKSQGKREALESLAHKQTAAVPKGNAVNGSDMETGAITPQNVDSLVAQHDLSWFESHRDAINKAMAG